MTIGTRLFTWLKGEAVGTDSQGNRYYRERTTPRGRRQKRWVLYNGSVEASRVPPDWHGWLHHTVEATPPAGGLARHAWQIDHQPNLSGTPAAYRPGGSAIGAGQRAKATGDYEAWKPE